MRALARGVGRRFAHYRAQFEGGASYLDFPFWAVASADLAVRELCCSPGRGVAAVRGPYRSRAIDSAAEYLLRHLQHFVRITRGQCRGLPYDVR